MPLSATAKHIAGQLDSLYGYRGVTMDRILDRPGVIGELILALFYLDGLGIEEGVGRGECRFNKD